MVKLKASQALDASSILASVILQFVVVLELVYIYVLKI